MVQCLAALLDFCYLARRARHTTNTLQDMQSALDRFHELRPVFEEVGVRPDGFSLPRQHALLHYIKSIQLFGSPNGLCSSITESKHIVAVKRPWRASNGFNPIEQILRSNTRMSKMAAARAEFGRRGMLENDVLTQALLALDLETGRTQAELNDRFRDEAEAAAAAGEHADSSVHLSSRPGM